VRILSDRLNSYAKNVIPLTGGEGYKKSRELLRSVADIPEDESFILIATGKYVGEGFDMPRLDTLFLAMPISWSGTVQQYAGRLHRLFDGKEEVQIYDYVDVHVTMLENMYQKRQRSYASIGYKAKGAPHLIERIHSIFDNNNFLSVYSDDILTARNEIVIVSPFLTKRRVLSALNYLTAANTNVTVVTKQPDNYSEKDKVKINECIEMLTQHGIIVKTRNGIHQKFAIMDQRIIWYGSINLLSYGTSED
jgi:superfamily II DNA or RNA helicase